MTPQPTSAGQPMPSADLPLEPDGTELAEDRAALAAAIDVDKLTALVDKPPADRHQEYLEVRGLRVTFDDFVAVDGIDLTVLQGDLRFLIGPNGAGKTTVIDAITGQVPSAGSIMFGHRQLSGMKVHRIVRQGVGRTFQTASVIEELSVLQNLDLAAGVSRPRTTLVRRRHTVPQSVDIALEAVGLARLRDVPAGRLAHGQKQWLEIGMLLVQDARLLLLDEPVAGMSQAEREETAALLRRLSPQRTVLVVEHDMDFMRAVADSVTVMHAGKVLSEGSVTDIQADPKVQEIYLGTVAAEGH